MIQTNKQQIRNQSPRSQKKRNSSEELTFLEHLSELRNRVFWVVLALVITSALGFQFKDILVDAIMAPLAGEKLVYLTPGGGFSFIFTLSIYFGLLLSIPVIVYQMYKFLQPLVRNASRKLVVTFISLSTLLAAIGATFGYYIAIPSALNFLTTFSGDAVTPNLTADSYLGFVVGYMLGLAALFQLPLLLFMIDYIKPFKPGGLLSSQRYVIIGSMVAAAIITPTPDMVNMLIIAMPVIIMYQVGAVAVFIHRRMRGPVKQATPASTRTFEEPEQRLTAVIEHEQPSATGGLNAPAAQPAPQFVRKAQIPEPARQTQAVQPSVHIPQAPQRVSIAVNTNSAGITTKKSVHVHPQAVQRIRPAQTNRIGGMVGPIQKTTVRIQTQQTALRPSAPAKPMAHAAQRKTPQIRRSMDGFAPAPKAQPIVRKSRPVMPQRFRSIDGFSMA